MKSDRVECPDCHAEIGEAVNINGLIMLRIGTFLIRDLQGVCMQCGRLIYFSVSNKIIAEIVRKGMLNP